MLIAGGAGLAIFFGTFGVFFVVLLGFGALWQQSVQSSDPIARWLGLLSFVSAPYVGFRIVKALTRGQDEQQRYADLYAAALRLKETGQELQGAMARGSRNEVISAELRWHHAVAAVETFRPS